MKSLVTLDAVYIYSNLINKKETSIKNALLMLDRKDG